MPAAKKQSPRQRTNTGKGQKKNIHLIVKNSTPELEVKGHRISIARLSKSRIYLMGSLAEAREVLALLLKHPDPDATTHIARYEQRIERTTTRLTNVTLALSAAHYAILRIEGAKI